MSPRRRVGPDDRPLFVAQRVRRRRPGLPGVIMLAVLLSTAAITVSTLVAVSHELHRRATIKDVAVLTEVRSFMTMFTSPDPFHANDYVDNVLAHATGGFAQEYQQKANQVLLAIARSEPTTGTVLDAGVERWNDDGSATVLVATENRGRSPDGKQDVNVAYRWLVTAQKEGDQWKISNLAQVI